jgi:hypothetical protein
MRLNYRILATASIILLMPINRATAQITIGDQLTFAFKDGGESQSCVVAPGLKTQCPKGRILVTRDQINAPARFEFGVGAPPTGLVVGRDLDKPNMKPIAATFNSVPDAQYYYVATDHDLVSLANGDVLYIGIAVSKRPVTPEPDWFKNTTRRRGNGLTASPNDYGPGVRTVALTWRSQDGGASFHYLSEFDPARQAGVNGAFIGAYPQFRSDSNNAAIQSKPWDMGGSDGPLAKVVPGTNRVLLSWRVVGYYPKPGQKEFVPDIYNQVNKTFLLESDGGAAWQYDGFVGGNWWRMGIVPLFGKAEKPLGYGKSNQRLVIGAGDLTAVATYTITPSDEFTIKSWEFDDARPEGKPYGWTSDPHKDPLSQFIGGNVWACTVVARAPGNSSQIIMVYPHSYSAPHTLAGTGNGCVFTFFDADKGSYAEGTPITPLDPSPTSYILHPTLIESGGGPVLLYWYDLNSKTMQGKIRGRIITGNGAYTEDFEISRTGGMSAPFAINQGHWFGDYHTGGGFVDSSSASLTAQTARFYPIWIQPEGFIHYAEVAYTYKNFAALSGMQVNGKLIGTHTVPQGAWKTNAQPMKLSKVLSPNLRREQDEYRQGPKR